MPTGFVFHELYLWHNTWNWALVFPPGLTVQPGEHAENPQNESGGSRTSWKCRA